MGQEWWSVYILMCEDGNIYTGITNDLEKRLIRHSSGRVKSTAGESVAIDHL